MKGGKFLPEAIYTLPIWDAVQIRHECPFCFLENDLEKRQLRSILSEKVTDPEYLSGEDMKKRHYCKQHFESLYSFRDKLGMALLTEHYVHKAKSYLKEKQYSLLIDWININVSSAKQLKCSICLYIDEMIHMYGEIFIQLWLESSKFRACFENSAGLCLPHMQLLWDLSRKINPKDTKGFRRSLLENEMERINMLEREIHTFIKDYGGQNGSSRFISRDCIPRTINTLFGRVLKD